MVDPHEIDERERSMHVMSIFVCFIFYIFFFQSDAYVRAPPLAKPHSPPTPTHIVDVAHFRQFVTFPSTKILLIDLCNFSLFGENKRTDSQTFDLFFPPPATFCSLYRFQAHILLEQNVLPSQIAPSEFANPIGMGKKRTCISCLPLFS